MKDCGKTLKVTILTVSVLCFLIASSARAEGIVLSKIEYKGECTELDFPTQPGQEAITGALVAIAASAIVNVGISFVTEWLKDLEDKYKGSDSASTVAPFYCTLGNKLIGSQNLVSYTRSKVEGDTSTTLLKIDSELEFYVNQDSQKDNTNIGIFTIRPKSIDYSSNIAKKGKTKDLIITYTFEFFDNKGKSKSVTVEPFVIKSISAGFSSNKLNEHFGASIVGSLPEISRMKKSGTSEQKQKRELKEALKKEEANKYYSPFKVKIDVAETATGNGEILAGQIAKAIGESMEKDKDSLAEMILDDWFDIEKPEDDEQGDGDKEKDKKKGK